MGYNSNFRVGRSQGGFYPPLKPPGEDAFLSVVARDAGLRFVRETNHSVLKHPLKSFRRAYILNVSYLTDEFKSTIGHDLLEYVYQNGNEASAEDKIYTAARVVGGTAVGVLAKGLLGYGGVGHIFTQNFVPYESGESVDFAETYMQEWRLIIGSVIEQQSAQPRPGSEVIS